jgi:hypothetical protein
MPVGSGINTQFGGLKETTYGTGVTPSKFLEIVSESISLNIPRIESKGLRSGSRVERSGRSVANRQGAGGDIVIEAQGKGMGWIAELCFGSGAVTTPGGGTLTRDQTFNLADTPPSATLQIGRPEPLTNTIIPYTYIGSMVTAWKVECDVDGLLTWTVTIDAQDELTATALATASYPASPTLFSYLGGVVTVGGVAKDVKKWSLSADNGLSLDRRFIRGSGLKKQPVPADFTNIKVGYTVEHNATDYALFTAGTLGTFSAAFTGPLIEGALFYGQTFTAPVIRIDGSTPNAGGPDIIEIDVTGTILHDPSVSANPLTAVLRGTDTAI